MNETTHADMQAATRFVQAGRLAEATALLQRLLRGEPQSAPGSMADAPAPGSSRIIDLTAETLSVEEPLPAAPQLPEALRRFLARATTTGLEPGLGGLVKPFPRPTADPLPEGALFRTGSHANHAGSRSYKLYVPTGRRGQPLPLVVMLHGCTQSPDDFAAGTRMNKLAEEQGFLVAYPAQDPAVNPSRCWSWFNAEDQRRGNGEPSLIAGITRAIMQGHPIDPARVYVAGLSAGGAAAAIMGRAYPDLYAAVGVHSGLAPGAASDMASAFAAMRGGATQLPSSPATAKGPRRLVPTIVFHGDQDKTVHPRNADQVVAQARGTADGLQATATVQRGRASSGQAGDGGRAWRRTLHADAKGNTVLEQWLIEGAGHAWSGGSPAGSYTDPAGPDASREMLRFFLEHRHPSAVTP